MLQSFLHNSQKRMKSNLRYRLVMSQLFAVLACLIWALLLVRSNDVLADAKNDQSTTKNELATSKDQSPPSLQVMLHQKRPKGAIFVMIPVAYRYGISSENAGYCSPTIRATNSSNATVEELIIGIQYSTAAGKPAGETITRYDDIKVRRQDSHFFYQLAVADCRGLEGQVTVVRCVYSTGEDCSSVVQAVGFGTIPLRLKSN